MTTVTELSAERANEASISLMAQAESFEITTAEHYQASGELLKTIKDKQKNVNATRKGITDPMDQAKNHVMELFRPVTNRLQEAEDTIKNAMLVFSRAEERRQREEQDKLDRQAKIERERLNRRAEKAREKGKKEKADVLEEAATTVQAPLAEPPTKAAGVHTRTIWKAEVTNKAVLIKAAASDPELASYLMVDMTKLNAIARTMKEEMAIPGVRAISEETVSARF